MATVPLAKPMAMSTGFGKKFVFEHVVYDQRFTGCEAFATEVVREGAAPCATQGDVTGIWNNILYHRWQNSPQILCGLTTLGAHFCLDQLAHDYGMRTLYKTALQPGDKIYSPADKFPAFTAGLAQANRAVHNNTDRNEPLVAWIIAPSHRSLRSG